MSKPDINPLLQKLLIVPKNRHNIIFLRQPLQKPTNFLQFPILGVSFVPANLMKIQWLQYPRSNIILKISIKCIHLGKLSFLGHGSVCEAILDSLYG